MHSAAVRCTLLEVTRESGVARSACAHDETPRDPRADLTARAASNAAAWAATMSRTATRNDIWNVLPRAWVGK